MASRIIGDRAVARNLRELSRGVPLALVDKAARQSMDPMLKDAKRRAKANRNYVGKFKGFPQPKPGRMHLDQGLVVGKQGNQTRTRRKFLLGAKNRARRLAHLLEFGTAPHFQPRFRGGFFHRGARARPFLSPAYESHGNDVKTVFGQELWSLIRSKILMMGRRR